MRVPFNRPYLVGTEFDYIRDAVERLHTSGDGEFSRRCHRFFEKELGVHRALLTTSCTDALEMSAHLLELEPGDEVIVPSFTFVSTANAFVLRGARPVFVDSRPDTFNLDEQRLESLITPRTRAIVPVHYAGVGCEMDAVLAVAERHGLDVVEDNAHGLFGRYRGRPLGTFGRLATQSFHETKNLICGEGGALLINDPALVERAEILREKGTDRSRFFRGEVDKYTWVDVGSSYLLSDILAAFLYAQITAREDIQARRRRAWEYYDEHLAEWAAANGVRRPCIPDHCDQPYHMYYLVLPSLQARTALIEQLRARDVSAVFHYVPLHTSTMGHRFGGRVGQCPVAEMAGDCLVRLPFYTGITVAEQEPVVDAIRSLHLPQGEWKG